MFCLRCLRCAQVGGRRGLGGCEYRDAVEGEEFWTNEVSKLKVLVLEIECSAKIVSVLLTFSVLSLMALLLLMSHRSAISGCAYCTAIKAKDVCDGRGQ